MTVSTQLWPIYMLNSVRQVVYFVDFTYRTVSRVQISFLVLVRWHENVPARVRPWIDLFIRTVVYYIWRHGAHGWHCVVAKESCTQYTLHMCSITSHSLTVHSNFHTCIWRHDNKKHKSKFLECSTFSEAQASMHTGSLTLGALSLHKKPW